MNGAVVLLLVAITASPAFGAFYNRHLYGRGFNYFPHYYPTHYLPTQIIQAPPQIIRAPPQIIQAPPQIIQAPPQIIQAPPQVIRAPSHAYPEPAPHHYLPQSPPAPPSRSLARAWTTRFGGTRAVADAIGPDARASSRAVY